MNKKILISIFMMFLMLGCFSPMVVSASPVAVNGRLKINGIYLNALMVTIRNVQTGQLVTTNTTSSTYGDGYYSCAIIATHGDILNISCEFEDKTYYNQVSVNMGLDIQWLNLSVVVNPGENAPSADFSWFPETIRAGMMISFTDNSVDIDEDIITYVWSIDGTVYTERNPYHVFANSGYKIITLTITDVMSHVDVCSKSVNILPPFGPGNHPPLSSFVYQPGIVYIDTEIFFDSTSSDEDNDIVAYSWRVNGGLVSTNKNMTYIFINLGNSQVNLTVIDSKGNVDTHSKMVSIVEEEILNITVKVKVNSQAVSNVNVTVYQNDTYIGSETTNDTGVAVLRVYNPGEYKVVARYSGVSEEKNATVSTSGLVILFNMNAEDGSDGFFDKQTPGFEIGLFTISLILVVLIIFSKKRYGKNSR